MYYKVYRAINNSGMCVDNSEINETVRILHGKRGEKLIFQRLSDGISKVYGVVINMFFRDVLLIKTDSLTWILEPV